MRAHLHGSFDTTLSPERVVAMLTDFSENRPVVWPTLDPDKYSVCELGDTHALVEEGTARPNIRVLERYDWSVPGTVSWTLERSNAFRPGTSIKAVVAPDGNGGSHVELEGQRIASAPAGYVAVAAITLLGSRFLTSTYKDAFDRAATARTRSADD